MLPAAALRGQGRGWEASGLGSAGITYITLIRPGFEYCSGSWVIRLPFVGKMGSRNGGEWRKDRPSSSVVILWLRLSGAYRLFPFFHVHFLFGSHCFYFFLLFFFANFLSRSPGIAMDGMEME